MPLQLSSALLLLIVAGALAREGWVERGTPQGKPREPIGPIYSTHTAAQTLELVFPDPIVAFDVRLATYTRRNDGTVTLHVRRTLADVDDVRTARVEAADVADNELHRFRLDRTLTGDQLLPAPQHPELGLIDRCCSPYQVALVFESSATTPGNAVTIWTTTDDPHPYGSASYDGVPTAGDLAVSVVYADSLAHVGLSTAYRGYSAATSQSGRTLLASWLLLLAPGTLLAFLVVDRRAHGLATQLATAPAFGVTLQPIAVLYATLAGVPLGSSFPWLVVACSALGLVVLELQRHLRRSGMAEACPPPPGACNAESGGGGQAPAIPDENPVIFRRLRGAVALVERRLDWALLGAMAIVFWGAFMRSFALGGGIPPGGDAFHHAVITQLIVDQGRLPESFAPYAPIESFSYHFGFHSYAALVALGGQISALGAMEYSAIVLNALIGLSVFGLARLAGLGLVGSLVSCLVVELVSPFPAQLLDVARYPQSAALVILPILVAFILGQVNQPREVSPTERWLPSLPVRTVLGGAILGGGLFLTHYRIALFGVAIAGLFIAWTVFASIRNILAPAPSPALPRKWGGGNSSELAWWPLPAVSEMVRSSGFHSLLIFVMAGLLVSPWVLRLMRTFTLGIRGSEGRYGPAYYSLERLGDGLMQPATIALVGVGVAGLALGIARRQRLLTLLGVWAALQLALSNPYWIPLPLVGQVDTVTVVTSLFFPLALGIGFLVDHAATWLRSARPGAYRPALVGLFVLGTLWGSVQLPGVIHLDRSMADFRDVQAAQWIASNVPPEAVFLVNATTVHWQPDFVVPTDGGYWLPLLARRATTLLPMLYPAERGVSTAQIERMERLVDAAARDVASVETVALLREMGVTHVYLGAAGGPIDERKLAASSNFRATYHELGVAIYELVG